MCIFFGRGHRKDEREKSTTIVAPDSATSKLCVFDLQPEMAAEGRKGEKKGNISEMRNDLRSSIRRFFQVET